MEEWLRDAGEPVSQTRVKSFMCETIGIGDRTAACLLAQVPYTVTMDTGELLHLSLVGIEGRSAQRLVDLAAGVLRSGERSSASSLFDREEAAWRAMGVTGPRMLLSLLAHFGHTEFDVSSRLYPAVTRLHEDARAAARKRAAEVLDHLRGARRPCSYTQLRWRFARVRTRPLKGIYAVVNEENVVRYRPGYLVHLEALGWTAAQSRRLARLARDHSIERERKGAAYATLQDLIERHRDELPPLDNDITWTVTLIGELLAACGSITLLGDARNAFVAQPNRDGITDFNDLIRHILVEEHGGEADLAEISESLRKRGIVRKRITEWMLRDDRVRIT